MPCNGEHVAVGTKGDSLKLDGCHGCRMANPADGGSGRLAQGAPAQGLEHSNCLTYRSSDLKRAAR